MNAKLKRKSVEAKNINVTSDYLCFIFSSSLYSQGSGGLGVVSMPYVLGPRPARSNVNTSMSIVHHSPLKNTKSLSDGNIRSPPHFTLYIKLQVSSVSHNFPYHPMLRVKESPCGCFSMRSEFHHPCQVDTCQKLEP